MFESLTTKVSKYRVDYLNPIRPRLPEQDSGGH